MVLARELSGNVALLVASQPTRGLDIAATEYLRNKLIELKNQNKGVILISADLDEIRSLSDRVLVLYEGKIMGELSPQSDEYQLGFLWEGNTSMKLLSKKSLSSFSILPEIIAILLAFLIIALILLFSGYSPLVAFYALFRGAFGSKNAWGQTLTQATPILFTALAFLLTFRTGIFNIGVEGQFLMGAIASALAGIYFSGLPAPLHIALSLLAGGVMGALWGLIRSLESLFRSA